MAKRKRTKSQSMIYKTLHRKLTDEQHEPYKTNNKGNQTSLSKIRTFK